MRYLIALFLCLPAPAFAECVILLHGLARTEVSLTVMQQVLESEGYDTFAPGYPSTDLPIDELAAGTLPSAIEACGDQTVNFVAHSMGGILIRSWMQDHKPANMGRVVMLGTPNQGSQLVDELGDLEVFGLLHGPAGLSLGTGPDSVPLSLPPVNFELGVIAGRNSLNPVFSAMIEGADDGKVSVQSTAVAGMRDHIVLPVTHTFMMNNPLVIGQTEHFLKYGHFDAELTWIDSLIGPIEEGCEEGQGCDTSEQEPRE
ncbi:alpha/beta hydrolase [Ruegeria sp. 2012CJ41-6]|uniref:Alpha/beta hydrolase n=1 Tax=Ruegeria spongiae TaxID=2942209 RepID=A0ABT0Q0D3_9RHOB|nr:alpha/beta fold hydrolase [Ruegeria spongiae]MCL6283336.1 alpha/beta hydrolase [Ruegeria spongiae]